jgi:hypothetical protein
MVIDFEKALLDSFAQLEKLWEQREETEAEIAKLTQFIKATMNMLPEDKRQKFGEHIKRSAFNALTKAEGLTEAVMNTLRWHPDEWYTAAGVRDDLVESSGFDFSGYSSNPLASVSTTLRRMKNHPSIETSTIDGVTVYKWKVDLSEALAALKQPAVGSKRNRE